MRIDDPYVALCFDEACAHFGNTIIDELNSVEGRNDAEVRMKQMMVLENYLGEDDSNYAPLE